MVCCWFDSSHIHNYFYEASILNSMKRRKILKGVSNFLLIENEILCSFHCVQYTQFIKLSDTESGFFSRSLHHHCKQHSIKLFMHISKIQNDDDDYEEQKKRTYLAKTRSSTWFFILLWKCILKTMLVIFLTLMITAELV